jgi:hypothetical protein
MLDVYLREIANAREENNQTQSTKWSLKEYEEKEKRMKQFVDGGKPLLLRKGVYPYEFVKSVSQMKSALNLPPQDTFFSVLTDSGITDEDYAHALAVWDHFECQNMLDYTRIYVNSDTILLAEVVLDLRKSVIDEFDLDICQHLSLPMLAKNIMLKTTDVKMSLMHDPEMVNMVKNSIRGGLSFINTRHFDADEFQKKHNIPCSLLYADANNLVSLLLMCILRLILILITATANNNKIIYYSMEQP